MKSLLFLLLLFPAIVHAQDRLPKPFDLDIKIKKDPITGLIQYESFNPTYAYILQDGPKIKMYVKFSLSQYLSSPNLNKVYFKSNGSTTTIDYNDREFKTRKNVEFEKTTTVLKDATLHKSAIEHHTDYFRAEYENRKDLIDGLIEHRGMIRLQGDNGVKEDIVITKADSRRMKRIVELYNFLTSQNQAK
jgi:hypothetical protein